MRSAPPPLRSRRRGQPAPRQRQHRTAAGIIRILVAVLVAVLAATAPACSDAKKKPVTEEAPARPYDLETLGLPRFNASPDLSNVIVNPPGYDFADAPDEQRAYDDRLKKIPGLQNRITATRIVTVSKGGERVAAMVVFRFADALDVAATQDFIDGQLETAQSKPQIVALGTATGLQFATPDGSATLVFPLGKAVVLIVAQNPVALQEFARAYVARVNG